MTEPIHCEIAVPVDPARAFDIFVTLGRWWPLAYSYAEDRFRDAHVEPRAGGRWFELDDRGKETAWGLVGTYAPGERLVLGWAIGADRQPEKPGHGSELELTFKPVDGGTRVTLEHRAFDRHSTGGETLREGMASPRGWPLILAEYAREARQRA